MANRISTSPPPDGCLYVEILGNGKYEAVSVGSSIVAGVWLGMGMTRKQFVVPIDRLEEAIASHKARNVGGA